MDHKFFTSYFDTIMGAIKSVEVDLLIDLADLVSNTQMSGGKIIIVGNGGSAAISSHVSVDFTKAAKIRAVNFNEADLLTCYSNDFGYENWVSEALISFCDPQDLVLLISSSGESPNILNAAKFANDNGISLVTFSGFSEDNKLRKMGKINFWCNSTNYNVVESVHQTWLLSVVDYLISRK